MGNISQSKKRSQLKNFDSYFEFEQNINKNKMRETIYISDLKVGDIILYGAGVHQYYKVRRIYGEQINMTQLSGQGKGSNTGCNSYEIQLHCYCIDNDYKI